MTAPKQGRDMLKIKFISMCQDEKSTGFRTNQRLQMPGGLLSRAYACVYARANACLCMHASTRKAPWSGIAVSCTHANAKEAHCGSAVKIAASLANWRADTFQLLNILFVEALVQAMRSVL